MLAIKHVSVNIGEREVLHDIDLSIAPGQVMVLFGPNGSGKSTLLKTIMGLGGYEITQGTIEFKGKQIQQLPIDQRVKHGLGIMFQHPPKIRGVKLRNIARFLSNDEKKIERIAQKLSLNEHLNREVNLNFSGGEMKRSELLQLLLQDPDLLLLDEPESGVDLENISLMGTILNQFLEKKGKSALIITHTGYILDYIPAKKGCVMIDGKFWCVGNPKEMFKTIREKGYEECKECTCR